MTVAVQQLYVRLQHFEETLATILQAARNELVKQVQNATSTTTHEELMKRADRLFKLRSCLRAVDQRNKLEPTTKEDCELDRRHRDSTRGAPLCMKFRVDPELRDHGSKEFRWNVFAKKHV